MCVCVGVRRALHGFHVLKHPLRSRTRCLFFSSICAVKYSLTFDGFVGYHGKLVLSRQVSDTGCHGNRLDNHCKKKKSLRVKWGL